MRTAFVVLTYNRPDALLAVLAALAPQCDARHVVVIADDGSGAATKQALQEQLPRFSCPVLHVWHPDVGFTAARSRNLGAACADVDYLVFLDGDCIPNPRFVAQHELLAAPGHFVNGSRVLLNEELSRQVLCGAVDLSRLDLMGWLRLRLRGDVNKLTHLVRWAHAPFRVVPDFRWRGIRSCNFGVAFRDFEAVNGFDECFAGWGHEDADLVLRLHHLGLRRKNGFFGTEVYHLWHAENSRASDDANRRRVMERMGSRQVRAELGLAQAGASADVVVRQLAGSEGGRGRRASARGNLLQVRGTLAAGPQSEQPGA